MRAGRGQQYQPVAGCAAGHNLDDVLRFERGASPSVLAPPAYA